MYHTRGNRAFELLCIRLKATKDSDSMLFGALYHPPKPSYKTSDLYEHIERSFDEVLRTHPDDMVVLAGDFNQLSLAEISSRTGLIPLVSVHTRGKKTLDMIMVTPPHKYQIKVLTSTVRTDHRAILASVLPPFRNRTKTSKVRTCRQKTPGQHANLLSYLRDFDNRTHSPAKDPCPAWDDF